MKINARCESITNIIIKEMEAGAVPWVKRTPKVFLPPALLGEEAEPLQAILLKEEARAFHNRSLCERHTLRSRIVL